VLVAFGFKHGVPDFIDFIFDVRSVPNPWKMNDFKVQV
jgi:RNase adaptor protein for sRNA GlmZ degradation